MNYKNHLLFSNMGLKYSSVKKFYHFNNIFGWSRRQNNTISTVKCGGGNILLLGFFSSSGTINVHSVLILSSNARRLKSISKLKEISKEV